jgi:GTP-binding protein Era
VSGAAGKPATRSGFIALAGRPNVGKSTLTNALVGAKVAIVSDKPQTTRRAIRGVAGGEGWQLVLIDLPGVQRPRDALTERMQRRVEHELGDADGCLMVVNGEQGIGPGDRFIAGLLARSPVPVVIAVNKIDRLDRAGTVEVLQAAAELPLNGEVFPISARTGSGVAALRDHLVSLLRPGPLYYDVRQRSDQSEATVLAEIVREQAVILVEAESQKGILIGAGGRMVKAIGTAARRSLEQELGSRVHLALSVNVRRHWRADERVLDRLGI